MKFILSLATFLTLGSAHASYFATHCSNSQATVHWETGHNSNTLTYRHNTIDEAQTKVPFYDLATKFSDEKILRQESIHRCGYSSNTKVFTAKVVITASEEKPDALDFLEGNKKIEAEVICTTHINGRSACPE